MQIIELRAWGSVALVALYADEGEPFRERLQLAFRFLDQPTAEIWRADAILTNLVCRLNARYLRTSGARDATRSHVDNLRQFVDVAQQTAEALRPVYGDRLADLLQHAAGEVKQAVDWPKLRLVNPPRDAKRLAAKFLAVDLWAMDQIRTTFTELSGRDTNLPGWDEGRTMLLTPAINMLKAGGLPHMKSDEGWKMRVRRLQIRPGEHDNLLCDVLSALRSGGPCDADGREMPA